MTLVIGDAFAHPTLKQTMTIKNNYYWTIFRLYNELADCI